VSEETNPFPPHGWTCFHCGEHFEGNLAGYRAARLHFGPTPAAEPMCTMSARKVRSLEEDLGRYWQEDTELHRQIRALEATHATELRREEEKGYARGLADARRLPEPPYVAVGSSELLVFSPAQACELAYTLLRKARDCAFYPQRGAL
jgi:hypothetical protein